jgi:hypothetical protein
MTRLRVWTSFGVGSALMAVTGYSEEGIMSSSLPPQPVDCSDVQVRAAQKERNDAMKHPVLQGWMTTSCEGHVGPLLYR